MAMNVWQAGTHANANNSLPRDALQQTTRLETVGRVVALPASPTPDALGSPVFQKSSTRPPVAQIFRVENSSLRAAYDSAVISSAKYIGKRTFSVRRLTVHGAH